MNDCVDIDIFVNEDIDKLENRINLSILGLMNQEWFHDWLLTALDMPLDAAMYPPKNEAGNLRPDFKIRNLQTGEILGRIEVETHFNAEQLATYKSQFRKPVKTIWGLDEFGGDLSLERIREKLDSVLQESTLKPQHQIGVIHLAALIDEALRGSSINRRPVQVSEHMRDFWLVEILERSLGNLIDFDLSQPRPRRLYANTIGPNGFSLRVRSEEASGGSVSILYITNGTHLYFNSSQHLHNYLPNHGEAITAWGALLRDMNCNIDKSDKRQIRAFLEKSDLEEHEARLRDCLIALCEQP